MCHNWKMGMYKKHALEKWCRYKMGRRDVTSAFEGQDLVKEIIFCTRYLQTNTSSLQRIKVKQDVF